MKTSFLKDFPYLIPREARAEGPSVARLINLSGRAGPSGAKPREIRAKNIFAFDEGEREPNFVFGSCVF